MKRTNERKSKMIENHFMCLFASFVRSYNAHLRPSNRMDMSCTAVHVCRRSTEAMKLNLVYAMWNRRGNLSTVCFAAYFYIFFFFLVKNGSKQQRNEKNIYM